ncbi:hypothetical protein AALP_AAs62041U000100 [Arabis alpina]|uniref:HSF-type DNA-binding domain-containing protein n=1 Tax=Arabis alpina TaxID=50452 RepID=A0A087G3J8_ARAAL|nr:hypothetical protein AALP_AAs62041U000100 [Arabis alpina]
MLQFNSDLYGVLEDPSLESIISWSKSNKSFVIWDPKELIDRGILAQYCYQDLPMLFRFLRLHGFTKVKGSRHLEFGHKKYFARGHPELMEKLQLEVAEKIKKKA